MPPNLRYGTILDLQYARVWRSAWDEAREAVRVH
jgi:hypothetical protein